jgi:hypothetical protein
VQDEGELNEKFKGWNDISCIASEAKISRSIICHRTVGFFYYKVSIQDETHEKVRLMCRLILNLTFEFLDCNLSYLEVAIQQENDN